MRERNGLEVELRRMMRRSSIPEFAALCQLWRRVWPLRGQDIPTDETFSLVGVPRYSSLAISDMPTQSVFPNE
jgi:hypothetical protein